MSATRAEEGSSLLGKQQGSSKFSWKSALLFCVTVGLAALAVYGNWDQTTKNLKWRNQHYEERHGMAEGNLGDDATKSPLGEPPSKIDYNSIQLSGLEHVIAAIKTGDLGYPTQCKLAQQFFENRGKKHNAKYMMFTVCNPGREDCVASLCNHAEYAARHGYMFYRHTIPESSELKVNGQSVHIKMVKYIIANLWIDLRRNHPDEWTVPVEWFLWVDGDTIFTDLDHKIEDFVAAHSHPKPGRSIDFIATKDPIWNAPLKHLQVQAGFMLFKTSEWSLKLTGAVALCNKEKIPHGEVFAAHYDNLVDQPCLTGILSMLGEVDVHDFVGPTVGNDRVGKYANIVSQTGVNTFHYSPGAFDRTTQDLFSGNTGQNGFWWRPGDWLVHFAGWFDDHPDAPQLGLTKDMELYARFALKKLGNHNIQPWWSFYNNDAKKVVVPK